MIRWMKACRTHYILYYVSPFDVQKCHIMRRYASKAVFSMMVPVQSGYTRFSFPPVSHRSDLVENYQRYRPRTRIPEDLLIYTMYTGMKMMIGSYHSRGSGLDKAVIGPLRKATGLQFSNHTLRRTFARGLWMQGVPIETISTLLGHRTNEVTRRYIGVRHSDMASALTRLPYSGRVKDESKRC